MKPLFKIVLLALLITLIGCAKQTPANDKSDNHADVGSPSQTTNGDVGSPKPAPKPSPEPTPEPDAIGPVPALSFSSAFGDLKFDTPVGIRHAGDGSGKLYVVEQPGRIVVVADNKKQVFLDLTDAVYDEGWEQGLLGLAFHPEYKTNGRFFVNYTTKSTTVIAEYKRSANNPDKADRKSARKLLEFKQPYNNHNGGELAFGHDGYLYIGTGDGGSGGDPKGNGQNRKSLLGKILRIDVDHKSSDLEYAIPTDNPFVGNKDGYLEEIYAYGLRNPWRFSFDTKTGLLWVADVGQNKVEEIDIIENGGNYGWNIMEGNSCYKPAKNCDETGLIMPVYVYNPGKGGASITGGYVYRGKEIEGLRGRYIFADFMDGRVWSLRYDGKQAEAEEATMSKQYQGITSFGTDEDGEMYACLYDGTILKLVPDGTDR